jgi:hypothetical protein
MLLGRVTHSLSSQSGYRPAGSRFVYTKHQTIKAFTGLLLLISSPADHYRGNICIQKTHKCYRVIRENKQIKTIRLLINCLDRTAKAYLAV